MNEKIFKLRGKTLVIIDWANVYGWFEKLKWEIDPKKLYDYLKSYPEIYDIRFYFGLDESNQKSIDFHKHIKSIGYTLIFKKVKFVPVYLEDQKYLRKIINILHESLDEIDAFVYYDWEVLVETEFLRKIIKIPVYRRKCDFDVEITLDVIKRFNDFNCLILFSGDGDYASLVKELIDNNKQVILVFGRGCKGKEYDVFNKGLYQCNVEKLRYFIQK
jgi:uncharacterized LabA/DUF88 family protein